MVITELRAENVKRLKAVQIRPDGNVVILGGQNENGKTSCLDSIIYALGGAKSFDDQPVRRGEDHADIVLELSGDEDQPGLIVTRRIDADGKTTLELRERVDDETTRKLKRPQEVLDALVGRIAFDPLAFSRMDPKKQATTLQELIGLDFSEIDAKRADLFEQRTEVNRLVKSTEAVVKNLPAYPAYPDAPAEITTVSELAAKLEEAHEHNQSIDKQTENASQLHKKAQDSATKAEAAAERIQALRDEIARLEKQAANDRANANEFAGQAERILQDLPPKVETAEIQHQIESVESVNEQVRANQKKSEESAKLNEYWERSDDLTNQIRALEVRRQKLVETAAFPIEGLGFSENGVTYDGLPFEQASRSRKQRVSAAIGMAMNPRLRIMLIEDGSLLDETAMRELAEMAEASGSQIWLEKVTGDPNQCSVLIEDGAVRVNGRRMAEASA